MNCEHWQLTVTNKQLKVTSDLRFKEPPRDTRIFIRKICARFAFSKLFVKNKQTNTKPYWLSSAGGWSNWMSRRTFSLGRLWLDSCARLLHAADTVALMLRSFSDDWRKHQTTASSVTHKLLHTLAETYREIYFCLNVIIPTDTRFCPPPLGP